MICEYGCGNEANYQLKNGKWCCCDNMNRCSAVRQCSSDKLKAAHKNNTFKGTTGKVAWNKGLTKYTDDRVLKGSINNIGKLKGRKNLLCQRSVKIKYL